MTCYLGYRMCRGCPYVTECYHPKYEPEEPDGDLEDSQLVSEFYSEQLERVTSRVKRERKLSRNAADGKVPNGVESMPKMSEHNPYLSAYLVRDGDLVKILDAGEWTERFDREIFEITVGLPTNQTKIWTMNKTTRDKLIKAYGDDSVNWIGKWVKISIRKQNVRGEDKDVLVGEPTEPSPTLSKLG